MSPLFLDLAVVLRQEIEYYRRLLALVQRERGRIVKGELRGLHDVVGKKEAIAKDLAALESTRASLVARLAGALGTSEEELTLARIARLAPGEAGETLQALLVEFRSVVGRLVAANDVNRTLLDRSLEFVHGSLSFFRTVACANPTYGKGGRVDESGSALAVLNRMA